MPRLDSAPVDRYGTMDRHTTLPRSPRSDSAPADQPAPPALPPPGPPAGDCLGPSTQHPGPRPGQEAVWAALTEDFGFTAEQARKALYHVGSAPAGGQMEAALNYVLNNVHQPDAWWQDLRTPSAISRTLSRDQWLVAARRGRLQPGEPVLVLVGETCDPYDWPTPTEPAESPVWKSGVVKQVLEGGSMCYTVQLAESSSDCYARSEASVRRVGPIKSGARVEALVDGQWVPGKLLQHLEVIDVARYRAATAADVIEPVLYTVRLDQAGALPVKLPFTEQDNIRRADPGPPPPAQPAGQRPVLLRWQRGQATVQLPGRPCSGQQLARLLRRIGQLTNSPVDGSWVSIKSQDGTQKHPGPLETGGVPLASISPELVDSMGAEDTIQLEAPQPSQEPVPDSTAPEAPGEEQRTVLMQFAACKQNPERLHARWVYVKANRTLAASFTKSAEDALRLVVKAKPEATFSDLTFRECTLHVAAGTPNVPEGAWVASKQDGGFGISESDPPAVFRIQNEALFPVASPSPPGCKGKLVQVVPRGSFVSCASSGGSRAIMWRRSVEDACTFTLVEPDQAASQQQAAPASLSRVNSRESDFEELREGDQVLILTGLLSSEQGLVVEYNPDNDRFKVYRSQSEDFEYYSRSRPPQPP